MRKIGPLEKLGTVWWFELFDIPTKDVPEIKEKLVAVIDEFEGKYSRFRKDSLISKLNETGSLAEPPQELIEMLHIACKMYQKTKGVFNIAVGEYLENIGYDSCYSFQSRRGNRHIPDVTQVLEYNPIEIRFLSGAKIDLGGLGKGYLIDKLAELLEHELGVKYFLINGGGDMYASSNVGAPITIGLQDPQSRKIIGSTELMNAGFASSSPYARSWRDQKGNKHDHLVSQNKIEKRAVYVMATNATDADMWATTLSIDHKQVLPRDIQAHIL